MEEISCNILELEARRGIYNFIMKSPGMHVREISRRLEIPFTTLQYHLRFLEKRELVKAKEDGNYTRYYVSFKFGRKEKEVVDLLRKKTTRSIIFYFLSFIVCSQIEISKSLEKHPTTIEFHLRKLEKMGIIKPVKSEYGVIKLDFIPYEVERIPDGSEKIYSLVDPYFIYDLLVIHKDSILEGEEFKGIFEYIDYYVQEGIPEKMISPRDAIDVLANIFWNMFPPSFKA